MLNFQVVSGRPAAEPASLWVAPRGGGLLRRAPREYGPYPHPSGCAHRASTRLARTGRFPTAKQKQKMGRTWCTLIMRETRPPTALDDRLSYQFDLLRIHLCYSMLRFRAGNLPSGPDFGRTALSGWPSAGRRADFDAFPVAVRPQSGPEGRCTARRHYCVT
jgi:hypothetical protein